MVRRNFHLSGKALLSAQYSRTTCWEEPHPRVISPTPNIGSAAIAHRSSGHELFHQALRQSPKAKKPSREGGVELLWTKVGTINLHMESHNEIKEAVMDHYTRKWPVEGEW